MLDSVSVVCTVYLTEVAKQLCKKKYAHPVTYVFAHYYPQHHFCVKEFLGFIKD